MSLSDADLQSIAEKLFLLNPPDSSKLSTPIVSDDLATRLQDIANNQLYQNLGIGVVDFGENFTLKEDLTTVEDPSADFPKVWLQNGGVAWRAASTGKLGMLLAAVQLRDDVRQVKDIKPSLNESEFDDLFSTIWKKKSKDPNIMAINGKNSAPRISTIFDFTKPELDFYGAGTLDLEKLKDLHNNRDLKWKDMTELTFYERLKLAGTWSDNIAATACISEIGVAYMKAVQLAYGLYDGKSMHLLLAGGYPGWNDKNLEKTPVTKGKDDKYRPLNNQEGNHVKDFLKGFGNESTQPASAAALTAYMIALMQDKLAGEDGCKTIIDLLANTKYGIGDAIISGVDWWTPDNYITPRRVREGYYKVGYLDEEGEKFRCEFTYLNTFSDNHININYAVIVTGLTPNMGYNALERGQKLSQDIYLALAK